MGAPQRRPCSLQAQAAALEPRLPMLLSRQKAQDSRFQGSTGCRPECGTRLPGNATDEIDVIVCNVQNWHGHVKSCGCKRTLGSQHCPKPAPGSGRGRGGLLSFWSSVVTGAGQPVQATSNCFRSIPFTSWFAPSCCEELCLKRLGPSDLVAEPMCTSYCPLVKSLKNLRADQLSEGAGRRDVRTPAQVLRFRQASSNSSKMRP